MSEHCIRPDCYTFAHTTAWCGRPPSKSGGSWAPCEYILWNTPDGRCPIVVDIGLHDHRVNEDGEVGILVQSREED